MKVLNKTLRPDSTGNNKKEFKGDVDMGDVKTYTPPKSGDVVKSALITVTQAELNAGKSIIDAIVGKTIIPLDIKMVVVGNFATGTSALLEDTNSSPVAVSTIAQAGLTDGAIINETESNTTMGAGYLAPLTLSKGLRLIKSGSDFTGGTNIRVRVLYKIA